MAPESNTAPLAELRPGERAVIQSVGGLERLRKRLREMGFVPGAEIYMEKFAPLGDPAEYVLRGSHVSIRRAEAGTVTIRDRGPLP